MIEGRNAPPTASPTSPRGRDASSASGPAAVFPPSAFPNRPSVPFAVPSARPNATPAPGGHRLIPISPDPTRANRPVGHPTNPTAFWDHYYKTHDEKAEQLLETVTYLGRARKFDQVEAAIKSYLQHHLTRAEPWMYETLAVALDMNQRSPEEVKTVLGYAAYLAKRSQAADQMILVADLLYLRGYYDDFEVTVGKQKQTVGAGVLLDRAAEVAPHLPEPAMMSANLAQKRNEPKRLANAIENLLSLGWPGIDDTIRLQARRGAEFMARRLREDQRGAEADALLAHLARSEGRDLYVKLSWSGDADLDLTVEEPLGARASHALRRTVFGGSIIKESLGGKNASEIYSCPRAFDGDYVIRVETLYNDAKNPVTEATLEIITREGLPDERKQTRTVSLSTSQPEPVNVTVTGGRRKVVLPFVAGADLTRVLDAMARKPAPNEANRPRGTAARPQPQPQPQPGRPSPSQSAADALAPARPAGRPPIDPNAGPTPTRPRSAPILIPDGPTSGRRSSGSRP